MKFDNINWKNVNDNFTMGFIFCLKRLQKESKAFEPWLFKYVLGTINPDYKYFDQNDAHECLM